MNNLRDMRGLTPDDYDAAKAFAQETYGKAIGEGRHRIVFLDGDEVIKIPTKDSGSCANEQEICEQGHSFARTRLDKVLSDRFGLTIIRMEYVEHAGFSEKSDWTWYIDGGQVGFTKDGCLVAYDWDRY